MKTRIYLIVLLAAFFCPSILFAQEYVVMSNPDSDHNPLHGVWAYDESNAFAVGYSGVFLKYNGSVWSQINTSSISLNSVWGSSPNDVWIGGHSGYLGHYDGETLTVIDVGVTGTILNIFGFSANDIYLCGPLGIFFHYNGESWSQIDHSYGNFDLAGMYGTDSDDLYLTAVSSTEPLIPKILHYNGIELVEVVAPDNYLSFKIWSPDNNLFYLGGHDFYRFDKSSGTFDKILEGFNTFCGLSADKIIVCKSQIESPDQYEFVIYDGESWQSYPSYWGIRSIYSPNNDPANIFMVGDQGAILHMSIASDVPVIDKDNDFIVYPNPASDRINVAVDGNKRIATIEIFNLVGQQVKMLEFGGNEFEAIDVSDLASGTFIIKIITAEGDVVTKKVTISK